MKLNLFLRIGLLILSLSQTLLSHAQTQTPNCNGLTATTSTTESRCTATGSIKIGASGGSGTYNYKVQGPASSEYTSSKVISGLPSGTYTVTVKDIVTNCTFDITNVNIAGSYSTPKFGITETDVTCTNGQDGTVSVTGLQDGRGPFVFTMVAPSTMAVGTKNSTGSFTGLKPGTYSVQMSDSCGAIQTRQISIQNYTWSISGKAVTVKNCTVYNAQLVLLNSKGQQNTSGTAFNGYQYGVVNAAGDTTWFTTSTFSFDLGQKRGITLVAKDPCGQVQSTKWSNNAIPSVNANVTINGQSCTGFNAAITSPVNLTTPNYCLVDGSGNPVTGQPCNTTGSFTNIPYGSYSIKVKNSCYDTTITRPFSQVQAVPSVSGAVAISAYTCTNVTATVTGQHNLTNPTYCLYTSAGNQLNNCNISGIFVNVPYGDYTIKIKDGCSGNIIAVPFTAAKRIRSVDAAVSAAGSSCTGFTATVTGATNLTTPQYCLLNALGNQVSCNSTGVFTGLVYGTKYCINVTDACNDTTIQRCINVARIPPAFGTIAVSAKTCTSFTATVTGNSNIYNGLYCLQDDAGHAIAGVPCNTTGIFKNLPYGKYCIKTTDGCTGTSNTTCVTVAAAVPSVGPITITNNTCAGYTATVSNQTNLTSPNFCILNAQGVQLSCNSTGVFNMTTYGKFSITTTDGCGVVLTSPFTVTKPVASVGTALNYSNQSCTTFTAAITGQTNLDNARYYLQTNTGTAVSDNTSGIFNNIAYGSYCINIVSSCQDTTIQRCFTVNASPTKITLSTIPSCTYQATDLTIQVTSGTAPYTVRVYDTLDNPIANTTSSNSTITFTGLPTLLSGQRYKVLVTGSCGSPALELVAATPSTVKHTYTITPKCPSSIVPKGSADLSVTATTTLTSLSVKITQKDFSPVTIGYSFNSGSQYTFSNLESATYILTYSFPGCTATVNDTVVLPNYAFPNLAKSAAYQCDNNSFSVGASVSGGIAPYTYEVIGSSPASPSINAAPQSSPVFTINNGTQYSLIRLRATDACGNAALNDVSILPLANTIVSASSNCIYQPTTLSTQTLPNATYTWYKKKKANSTDSTLVGTGTTYTIPALAVGDTGIYVSRVSVNSGCLTQLSYFHLNGDCGGLFVLASSIDLKGNAGNDGTNQLRWAAPITGSIDHFIPERSDGAGGQFVALGNVPVDRSTGRTAYSFTDQGPLAGTNYYRLRIESDGNNVQYSNVVSIASEKSGELVSAYPNPASGLLNIAIKGVQSHRYSLGLYTITGQAINTGLPAICGNGAFIYQRDPNVRPGLYILKVADLTTGENQVIKIVFK